MNEEAIIREYHSPPFLKRIETRKDSVRIVIHAHHDDNQEYRRKLSEEFKNKRADHESPVTVLEGYGSEIVLEYKGEPLDRSSAYGRAGQRMFSFVLIEKVLQDLHIGMPANLPFLQTAMDSAALRTIPDLDGLAQAELDRRAANRNRVR